VSVHRIRIERKFDDDYLDVREILQPGEAERHTPRWLATGPQPATTSPTTRPALPHSPRPWTRRSRPPGMPGIGHPHPRDRTGDRAEVTGMSLWTTLRCPQVSVVAADYV